MKKNDDTRLKLVGCLNFSKEFRNYDNRIERINFVDWRELPRLLSSVDINLMPLDENFFNSCKSENKWMEAALVKKPTVASWNIELDTVTKNHKNIILCKTHEQWDEYFESAKISDIQIAEEAYKFVLGNKTTITSASVVNEILC